MTKAITRLRSIVPSERLPPSSVDRALGDVWQLFLCAALASLYHTRLLRANACKRPLTSEVIDQGQEAWLLTAACKLGDLDLIRRFSADFDMGPLTAEAKCSFLLSCLCAAIREDWQPAFNFLLELQPHLDLNANDPVCGWPPIRIAAHRGRVGYVETLFHPRHRLRIVGLPYERAIAWAASFPVPLARKQLVHLFIEKREGFLSHRMRKEVLWAACRWNHHDVAALVLKSGDADVFTSQSFATGLQLRTCALWVAAEYNSITCVELMFATCRPSDLQKLETKTRIASALRIAAKNNHLDMMRLILPHETCLSFSEQFLLAATVDGGIAAMEAFRGPDCLQSIGDLPAADTARRHRITFVGGEALRLAVNYLCPSNVEVLMKRGVRTTSALSTGSAKSEKEVDALKAIQGVLERWGYKNLPTSFGRIFWTRKRTTGPQY